MSFESVQSFSGSYFMHKQTVKAGQAYSLLLKYLCSKNGMDIDNPEADHQVHRHTR